MGNRHDITLIILVLTLLSSVSFGFLGIIFWICCLLPIFILISIAERIPQRENINPSDIIHNTEEITNRDYALQNVKLFLAPYNSIWSNLRISNKYVTLRLGSDGRSISFSEKFNPHNSVHSRFCRITGSTVYNDQILWDMFCLSFDHQTTYDRMIELCLTFKASYKEDIYIGTKVINRPEKIPVEKTKNDISESETTLVDINNASEIEITALPGISIVLAKKLVQKREAIRGFKSVEDVLKFLKMKPHMEKQLRNKICVNKMQGSLNIERHDERSVDL